MFAVMLECHTGTNRLVGDAWEGCYHIITWCQEDNLHDAEELARHLKAGSPREIKRAYVRPWDKRFD